MNDTDKVLHKALHYFSKEKPKALSNKEFEKLFPPERANTLVRMQYISKVNNRYVITDIGLEELRKLENTRRGEWAILISIIALIFSFFALVISIFIK